MALKDVRDYYYSMLAQYLEEKQNLEDFAEGLKEGFITEEQMQEAVEIVEKLEENYHRLTYIMYLINMPNRPSKKTGYTNQHQAILNEFKRLGADTDSVVSENEDMLKHFKATLKAMKEKDEH